MMKRQLVRYISWLITTPIMLSLAACSMPEMLVRQSSLPTGAVIQEYEFSLHQTSTHTFDRIDLASIIAYQQRPKQVDTLLLVFDAEGLKDHVYRGIAADVYGRELIRRFHQTLPTENNFLGETLQTVGIRAGSIRSAANSRRYDISFNESALDRNVGLATLSGSSLAKAIDELSEYSLQRQGKQAVVLVTSWDRIDQLTENAVMRLRQRHESSKGIAVEDRTGSSWAGRLQPGFCFHAIGIGNSHSRERLYTPESCGSYWAGDAIMQPSEMAEFILSVLYGPPNDSDNDGIPNYLDLCPDTPPGRMVTSRGCLRFPQPDDAAGSKK
ncbi:MAG: hypothetical protein RLZZ352_1461 [Pseudomonadota bacterium]|jgi:hypothetical protein